jgi:hypothetical protein
VIQRLARCGISVMTLAATAGQDAEMRIARAEPSHRGGMALVARCVGRQVIRWLYADRDAPPGGVATGTLIRRPLENAADVAGFARYSRMLSAQWKPGLKMIEVDPPRFRGRRACHAQNAETKQHGTEHQTISTTASVRLHEFAPDATVNAAPCRFPVGSS